MIINGVFGRPIDEWFYANAMAYDWAGTKQLVDVMYIALSSPVAMRLSPYAFKVTRFVQLSREMQYKLINSAKEYARCYE